MIKNIVFDLGNVLLSWKPDRYFEKSGYDSNTISLIMKDIFGSPVWSALDNGDITTADAIEQIAQTSSLKKEFISSLFGLRTEIINPLTDNIKLLPRLKESGFKLYYLSNFPLDFFEEVKNEYDFFDYFDGGIISAAVRHSKPDIRIYRILLDRYQLKAEECFYIDDVDINVRAAESAGMTAYCYDGENGNSGQLHSLTKEMFPGNPPG
ncbi:MAG: HAD family phosphatase [Bacteroidales bacterium]|nr:HAD family phosphatase [Bacteroidales bacterium]